MSIASIPAAKLFPQTSAQTWAEVFNRGIALMPKVAVTVALAYGYAAYDTRRKGGNWTGFAAAALLVVAIVPFTIVFMGSTNDALHSVAKGASTLSGAQVSGLLDKWGALNLARSLFPLAGAATGLIAFLGNVL